jgi:signal transduction histidine kinase
VRADDAAGLPVPQQVGLYHVAAEAVLNARKHAGASRVTVDLAVDASGWRLDVADDGSGLGPDTRAGIGLNSMRERAEDLQATFEITESAEGGCRIVVAAMALAVEEA